MSDQTIYPLVIDPKETTAIWGGDALVMTTHRQLEVRDVHTGKIRWALE